MTVPESSPPTAESKEIVRRELSNSGASDSRWVSLDGVQVLCVETDGSARFRLVGAFYLLDEHGHRMLPVDADLSIEPGATSTIKVAGSESVLDLPHVERRFVAALEAATWPHCVNLVLV